MNNTDPSQVRIKVVGVGGAGGNALSRMTRRKDLGLEFLAINTDVQALSRIRDMPTFAIGPAATRGMGSGGDPDIGQKAMRESLEQVSQLIDGADMVFIAAGMGGGTGTGAAPLIAELAKKQGALTVGVVTRPFSFEGNRRREVSDLGTHTLQQKMDTLIAVANDKLLSSLDGDLPLENAFSVADEALRQGVEGITEIIRVPGLINVDFADVRAVMADGGPAFMATGEGKGRSAAHDAVQAALSNPMFEAPLQGCRGILLNIRGGKDLALGQVHEIAGIVRDASRSRAQVIFGVVNDKKWKKRVSVTVIATGIGTKDQHFPASTAELAPRTVDGRRESKAVVAGTSNGHGGQVELTTRKML